MSDRLALKYEMLFQEFIRKIKATLLYVQLFAFKPHCCSRSFPHPQADSIYEHVLDSYPQMSRFSVALMGENSVSNYYVKDTMADVGRYDFEQHELRDNSSLTSIAYTANIRIISDLRKMFQTIVFAN